MVAEPIRVHALVLCADPHSRPRDPEEGPLAVMWVAPNAGSSTHRASERVRTRSGRRLAAPPTPAAAPAKLTFPMSATVTRATSFRTKSALAPRTSL